MSEKPAKNIYLGIGSNLGNKRKNIDKAKIELYQNNIKLVSTSSFYESLSWPNSHYPKFLNIVINVSTSLPPIKLLEICKKIEIKLGRKKTPKNHPRVCDIDILDYKGLRFSGKINLPHPRLSERNFVLIPLFEISKNWTHPESKFHIKELINLLKNKDIRSIKQI